MAPASEIISEGNVGLMQALNRFEPDKGFRFTTYAMWWVRASIHDYILRSWSLVKIGTTANQKRRKLISQLLIFNENKRYEVKQNLQTVSTLVSTKPADGGYWVTELPDVRRRFWFRQKITYLLTIIDPLTIEIRNNARRAKFVK